MFLPQRPYLSIGTLRDQVIYPDGHGDMQEKRKTEDDLKRILEEARLGYLPDREGGWDTRKEWKDVLSGGEKQRMAFARVLYHEPHYAIIDEGTSAVSSDVEGHLYEICKEKGISEFFFFFFSLFRPPSPIPPPNEIACNTGGRTVLSNCGIALITISTRASLKRYHEFNLILGGGEDGDEWEFERIGTEREKLQVEKELHDLRERLAQVEMWKTRKEEIEKELAQVWVDGGDSLNPPPYVENQDDQGRQVESGEDVTTGDGAQQVKEETKG